MSLEVVGGWLFKILGTGIIGALSWIGWLTKTHNKKLQDVYTKQETDKQIDLKIAPVETSLSIKMESVIAATKEATAQRKETNKMLARISEDVAVVKAEVNNLKENK
jgi:hypothetical protein